MALFIGLARAAYRDIRSGLLWRFQCGGRSSGRGMSWLCGGRRRCWKPAYADRFFTFGDLNLCDSRFFQQFNQFLYFANVHGRFLARC